MEFCGAYVQGLFLGAGPYLFGPHVPGQPKKPIAVNRTAQRANFITMGLPIQEAVLVSAPAPKYTAKTTQPGRRRRGACALTRLSSAKGKINNKRDQELQKTAPS